jgi:hypothetical protein
VTRAERLNEVHRVDAGDVLVQGVGKPDFILLLGNIIASAGRSS